MRAPLRLAVAILLLPFAAAAGQNALLRELAKEDQAAQRGDSLTRSNDDRVKLVLEEIGKGRVKTAGDQVNAALVLQHTGMTFCGDKLVGRSPDNYLLAHHLAVQAYRAGRKDAAFLVAQTIDRYLSITQGIQKYGTNRFINQQTGEEELAPIDRKTTDAERAKYGVPPLAKLLKRYHEMPLPRPATTPDSTSK